jgi:TolA-binding protein
VRCRRAREWLSPYHDGELKPGESKKLEDHLLRCAGCRDALRALSEADLTASVPDPGPAYFERMTAKVMGRVAREPAPAGAGARTGARVLPLSARRKWAPGARWASGLAAAMVLLVAGRMILSREWTPDVAHELAPMSTSAEERQGVAPGRSDSVSTGTDALEDRISTEGSAPTPLPPPAPPAAPKPSVRTAPLAANKGAAPQAAKSAPPAATRTSMDRALSPAAAPAPSAPPPGVDLPPPTAPPAGPVGTFSPPASPPAPPPPGPVPALAMKEKAEAAPAVPVADLTAVSPAAKSRLAAAPSPPSAPLPAAVLYQRSRDLFDQGRFREAISPLREFQRWYYRDPLFPRAMILLARALDAMDQRREADNALADAYTIAPKDRELNDFIESRQTSSPAR